MTCINIQSTKNISFNIILFSSGMQAPLAEVHVVLEVPSEAEEGMCSY